MAGVKYIIEIYDKNLDIDIVCLTRLGSTIGGSWPR